MKKNDIIVKPTPLVHHRNIPGIKSWRAMINNYVQYWMGTGHCLNGQKTKLICLRYEPQPVLVLCCLIYAPSLYGGLMWVCSSLHRQGQHHCSIFTSMVRPGERSSRREKHFSQKKINYLPSPDITPHHITLSMMDGLCSTL